MTKYTPNHLPMYSSLHVPQVDTPRQGRGITERLCKPAARVLPLEIFIVHSLRIRNHTVAAIQVRLK
jgi:hypothetical protein